MERHKYLLINTIKDLKYLKRKIADALITKP